MARKLHWSFVALLFSAITATLVVYQWGRKPDPVILQASSAVLDSWSSINYTILTDVPTGTSFTPSLVDSSPPFKDVIIYVENIDSLNVFYSNDYVMIKSNSCELPYDGKCILQTSKESAMTADVVFKMVRFIHPQDTVRFYKGQLLAVLNSEAERDEYGLQQLREADIRVDHHPSSDILWAEACYLPVHMWETSPPADPAKRKGIALFTSNCAAKWRLDYLKRLYKAIPIDSYGRCLHNMDEPRANYSGKWANMVTVSSKYRMVVVFENIIQDDYISEKIVNVFASGAIPVYWGPPQIYSWVPGNHSFIDAGKYSPVDLALYLKRIDEEDDVFKYHTSNFDVNKTKDMIERLCANNVHFMCQICQLAQKKLIEETEKVLA